MDIGNLQTTAACLACRRPLLVRLAHLAAGYGIDCVCGTRRTFSRDELDEVQAALLALAQQLRGQSGRRRTGQGRGG